MYYTGNLARNGDFKVQIYSFYESYRLLLVCQLPLVGITRLGNNRTEQMNKALRFNSLVYVLS